MDGRRPVNPLIPLLGPTTSVRGGNLQPTEITETHARRMGMEQSRMKEEEEENKR